MSHPMKAFSSPKSFRASFASNTSLTLLSDEFELGKKSILFTTIDMIKKADICVSQTELWSIQDCVQFHRMTVSTGKDRQSFSACFKAYVDFRSVQICSGSSLVPCESVGCLMKKTKTPMLAHEYAKETFHQEVNQPQIPVARWELSQESQLGQMTDQDYSSLVCTA